MSIQRVYYLSEDTPLLENDVIVVVQPREGIQFAALDNLHLSEWIYCVL